MFRSGIEPLAHIMDGFERGTGERAVINELIALRQIQHPPEKFQIVVHGLRSQVFLLKGGPRRLDQTDWEVLRIVMTGEGFPPFAIGVIVLRIGMGRTGLVVCSLQQLGEW